MTENKKIPKFSSEAEEAEFWATHDTVDYWEDTEEVKDIEIDEKFRNTVLKCEQHEGKSCQFS